ncbi:dihydrolipoyl dehydrogenase [Gimesia sp.]|uniref:dihydrolipoyl dehydrogenase n=1 Tax=Gimesia sp. TaxID=2024833 RepID=UPI000C4665FF|nr:dihydrolipoyl dehydrogenase [Gimesia sp.]MAX37276.1 dihydrolipoyl dehydrogenase [Gimesia sp.]|tara:strand:+ start:7373 stop:8800 length:1428 start_codon:yes stop_codon:yes gene_type:complete
MSGSATRETDIVVIGGGPGGYPAAFEAADKGYKVIMVNDDVAPGGVCLNRGCIPSKALLHVAKLINETKESAEWGITFQKPEINLDQLRDFKNKVVTQLTGGIGQLAGARNVEILKGFGRFKDAHSVEVSKQDGTKETIQFKYAIVATGSSPAVPPVFDLDDDRIMDSSGALELADIPAKLLVVGGGYIGLEMGSVYAALGSEVTVVEMTGGLLPGADRDLVRPLQKRLTESFAAIHLNTKVEKLTPGEEGITADLSGEGVEPQQLFDRVLISIGRRPNNKGIGFENTKLELDDRGFIKHDAQQRTAEPHIYAIGDIAGEPMLAHKATREAKVAVESIAGEFGEFDNIAIPAVVFTDPEIAWCGVTEQEAKDQGLDVEITRFPWAASGRAQTLGRTEGLTKMIFDKKTGRVLGVGIVGPGAGELIAEGVLAVEMAAVAEDVAESIHAHPTLSETLMEGAEAFIGQATHMYKPKRK